MRIWLKRNIIATLTMCSYAISTPLFSATENDPPIKSKKDVVTVVNQPVKTVDDGQPASANQERQYLFQDDNPAWLNGSLNTLQSFQVWMGGHVQNTSDGIDNYFGSGDEFELTKGNRLDIMTPIRVNDNGELDMQLRVRAKLALPKLRNRWHLLIKSQDDIESGGDLTSESTGERSKTSLAVQALLTSAKGQELYFDVGARTAGLMKLNPYVRLKKRYEIELDSRWKSRMAHSLFWERVDGVGLDSTLVFDRPIDKRHLFRAQSDGTWWDSDAYYDLKQRLLLYKTVNAHRVFTYQGWAAFNSLQQSFQKTGYGLTFNWRERAYKNWLYFEVEPAIKWVEDNDFERADISIMVMLEMRFFKLL